MEKVAQGKSKKKADGRKCRRYAEQSERRLPRLQAQLQAGSFQPRPVQRIWIPQVRQWVEQAGLVLHTTKRRLVDASQAGGIDFLGYHFERGHRRPRQKSLDKFKEAIRAKTPRLRAGSMRQIVADVNRTLRGWMGYFKHGVTNVSPPLDQWVRGRLRTIERKRHQGKGRARGRDHQRWPNAYFAELGLISLALIRAQASNPQSRGH